MSSRGREDPDDLDRFFKALGHITRRRILRLLAQHPRYPYELSKILGPTSRVILKHLEALEQVGFVVKEPGESDLGPDRTYYRLNASFGLSTTILPNSFVIRLTQSVPQVRLTIPRGFALPKISQDVKAVRLLLKELAKVNKKLNDLDDERLRFANLRGQIIQRIENIMTECSWDNKTCQKVRQLINPISTDERRAKEPLKKVLEAFEEHIIPERQDDETEREIRIEFE